MTTNRKRHEKTARKRTTREPEHLQGNRQHHEIPQSEFYQNHPLTPSFPNFQTLPPPLKFRNHDITSQREQKLPPHPAQSDSRITTQLRPRRTSDIYPITNFHTGPIQITPPGRPSTQPEQSSLPHHISRKKITHTINNDHARKNRLCPPLKTRLPAPAIQTLPVVQPQPQEGHGDDVDLSTATDDEHTTAEDNPTESALHRLATEICTKGSAKAVWCHQGGP